MFKPLILAGGGLDNGAHNFRLPMPRHLSIPNKSRHFAFVAEIF